MCAYFGARSNTLYIDLCSRYKGNTYSGPDNVAVDIKCMHSVSFFGGPIDHLAASGAINDHR